MQVYKVLHEEQSTCDCLCPLLWLNLLLHTLQRQYSRQRHKAFSDLPDAFSTVSGS